MLLNDILIVNLKRCLNVPYLIWMAHLVASGIQTHWGLTENKLKARIKETLRWKKKVQI